jgi:hypothetical protein
MCEFKIGDTVIVVGEKRDDPAGNHLRLPGYIGKVTGMSPYSSTTLLLDGQYVYRSALKLHVDPICEAKALLEKEGWSVSPPPPKKMGKLYILQQKDRNYPPFATCDRSAWSDNFVTLAIVDWTEGQGL